MMDSQSILNVTVVIFFFICHLYVIVETKPLTGKFLKSAEEKYLFTALIVGKDQKGGVELVCVGSLISRNQILTAASCLEDKELTDLQVLISTGNLKAKKKNTYSISSKVTYGNFMTELRLRKQFKFSEIEDMAILELSVDDTGITPAQISYKTDVPTVGATVKIVGFSEKGAKAVFPRATYGSLKVLKKQMCDEQAKLLSPDYRKFVWSNKIFCAQSYPSILAIDGDFGGPVLNEKGQIVGILFRGRSDSEPVRLIPKGQANLALRIGYYEDFISAYKH